MKRREAYRQYLKSGEWREQRAYALERTSGFCQFCGEVATQVHHTRYPKQFGNEHPHSLIPVCDRCHQISHGVQNMKEFTEATLMTELSPVGVKFRYILSGCRVYASAKSWMHALKVPSSLKKWFEDGLARHAILKKDEIDGELEAIYQGTVVYRWHVVARQLRTFDQNWNSNKFVGRGPIELEGLRQFYENYERLVNWGYDLQEKALSALLNPVSSAGEPVTQETLTDAIRDAVAPRLQEHDGKIREHDIIIEDMKGAMPTLRDQNEFITVKQALNEQGLDSNSMPYYPLTKENLSGIIGQILKKKGVTTGKCAVTRIDGQAFSAEMNTYRRQNIYDAITEVNSNKQEQLF